MNKITDYCTLLILTMLLGCGSDDKIGNRPLPIPEGSISLVNAFPQLSFNNPLDLQAPADGSNRIFVAEQQGLIKVFDNDPATQQSAIFLDIQTRTNTSDGELGLLGFAFHPNYSSNGYFYVNYTPAADESVISRFQVSDTDPNFADPGSETILLRISQPFTNHNGGQLAFGPDGFLYIGSGDGGSGGDPQGNAQNLGNLLGKILRIDVDGQENGMEYAIPPNNPFIATNGARPEIYAYGLRNPWRFSFDTQTGLLWAGDVGQGNREEIDIIEAAGNYGWNILEGNSCYNASTCDDAGLTPPVFDYTHDAGDKSITGGFVYRGSRTPSLVGYYVYADFISGRIWGLSTSLSTISNDLLVASELPIASFGRTADNELLLCSFNGIIYQFEEN